MNALTTSTSTPTPTPTPTPTTTPIPSYPDTPRVPHRRQRQQPQPQPLKQQSAAKGSLRSLLLQHSSKRLYVHPLSWIPLHLELFCCYVTIKELIIPPSPPQQHSSQYLQNALEVLNIIRSFKGIGLQRNKYSRQLITLLGLEAQPNCQIGPGYVETLALFHLRSSC